MRLKFTTIEGETKYISKAQFRNIIAFILNDRKKKKIYSKTALGRNILTK